MGDFGCTYNPVMGDLMGDSCKLCNHTLIGHTTVTFPSKEIVEGFGTCIICAMAVLINEVRDYRTIGVIPDHVPNI